MIKGMIKDMIKDLMVVMSVEDFKPVYFYPFLSSEFEGGIISFF